MGLRWGGGESAVAAAQGFFHLKLIHAQFTVPAPPFRGAYGGHRRNRRSNYRVGERSSIRQVAFGRSICLVQVVNTPVAAYNGYPTLTCGPRSCALPSGHTPGNRHDRRAKQQGQMEKVGAGYTFFWNGWPKAERRDAGVAFVIRNDIVGRLPCQPQGINDRLMSIRLPLWGDKSVTIIRAHALLPTD
ncbi:unnamed protein product [Schistocephalus solidus]|uniref:Transposase n=1 Tax=Schistocephalus solidus TaxID=70667 RepID=A0A183T278_SCHSO|nr:unnamed protein product [Schistocephalus solidus]